ncbi:MAG TPA: glycosyltransferase family 39 protein, partial [Mycobacteriales bacterium]|nr:glycosyltransferase family 39 protein [Mycobacteriales bacterium]
MVVGCWGLFQNLWHLSAANWLSDEPTYARAGWRYVHGLVDVNLEHPLTAKYLIGLSELVFGQNSWAVRLPAATASLATGVLLWWWVRQEAGRAAGVLCAGVWLLLPRWVYEWGPRLDRFGMLEPVLALFATAALYAGWRWTRTGRWRWPLVAGVALALATTSKESGVVLAPVLALAGPVSLRSVRAVGQLAAGAGAAAATAAVTYLGAGGLSPIGIMLRFQSHHNSVGHLVAVRGHLYVFAPWWANLWDNEQAYGALLSGLLAGCVIMALV